MKHLTLLIFILLSANIITAAESMDHYSGWLVTSTPHFKIIYEKTSIKSVNEIVSFSEDVYNSVTSFFNSYPEKIILVVHDRMDIANGSFYPAPQHINLYVTAPSEPEFGAKVDNWLKFLLTHELTHYVNMTIKKGLFYQLSKFMGKSVSSIPGGLMPGWAIEGIAVKLESDLTVGGRGNNPFFEMYSKALIMENRLFSWRQAAYTSLHPPFGRIYISGYLINDYMARKYGNDIFVKIYRDFLNFPLLGFNHYVKKITGDSTKKIFLRMESELIEKYSTTSATPGKLLSPDIESDYFLPEITNSGWIVYRETKDKEPALVLIDPVSKIEKILIKTRLTDHSSYSATEDSKLVVFAALNVDGRHPTGLTAVSDLYLYSKQTNKVNQITHNAHLRQPAISQDGKRIIAVQKAGQYTRLIELDISTQEIKPLFQKEKTSVFNPVFSPNSEDILFTALNITGRKMWILKKGNNKPIQIDADGAAAYNPRFLDNKNIIFISDKDGIPEIYETGIKGIRSTKKIFSDPVGIFSAEVSNNKLIYSTYSYRGYTLREISYTPTVAENKKYTLPNKRISVKNDNPPEIKGITSPPTNLDQSVTPSLPYRDIPKLVVISPIPFYLNPLYDSTTLFAPGFTAYFQSILGKNTLFTTASLNTSVIQPALTLDFSSDFGPLKLEYNLLQGYREAENLINAVQTSRQQLIFNVPLLSRSNLGESTYWGLYTGFIDDYSIISNEDFPFFSPSTVDNTLFINEAYHINGIVYTFGKNKSRNDLVQPFLLSTANTIYTPVSLEYLKEFAFKSISSLNFPSFIDHHVFRISGSLTYSGIDKLQFFNNLRGFSRSDPSNPEFLLAGDYLFNIKVPDWPVFWGLSLQGISGAIHVEKLFSLKNKTVLPDKNIYLGSEIILLGNYINVFKSAGIGVNYRIEPNSQNFNSKNLGIYMFIGTNSFK